MAGVTTGVNKSTSLQMHNTMVGFSFRIDTSYVLVKQPGAYHDKYGSTVS